MFTRSISEVIEGGIKWILSLLLPARAFVKAAIACSECLSEMIVDVAKFFIQQGSQVMELVNAFIESISAIAAGNISKVAQSIEQALAVSVPVLIGFFTALLGIGDLVGKVQKIFRKITDRITATIDGFIEKAGAWFKDKRGRRRERRAEREGRNGREGEEEGGEKDPQDKAKVDKGIRLGSSIINDEQLTKEQIEVELGQVKRREGLDTLGVELVSETEQWHTFMLKAKEGSIKDKKQIRRQPSANDLPMEEKEERLRKALSEAYDFIGTLEFPVIEDIVQELSVIKQKYELKELKPIEKSTHDFYVHAEINPKLVGEEFYGLSKKELRDLKDVAKKMAVVLKSKGASIVSAFQRGTFAQRKEILKNNTKTGDIVEAIAFRDLLGMAEEEQGMTLLRNIEVHFIKDDGQEIEGMGPELDFMLLGEGKIEEVISAKTKVAQFSIPTDRKSLDALFNFPLNDIARIPGFLKGRYGRNRGYDSVVDAEVSYNNGSRTSLKNFRNSVIGSNETVDQIRIVPLSPDNQRNIPEEPEREGYRLNISEDEMFAEAIKTILRHL